MSRRRRRYRGLRGATCRVAPRASRGIVGAIVGGVIGAAGGYGASALIRGTGTVNGNMMVGAAIGALGGAALNAGKPTC